MVTRIMLRKVLLIERIRTGLLEIKIATVWKAMTDTLRRRSNLAVEPLRAQKLYLRSNPGDCRSYVPEYIVAVK